MVNDKLLSVVSAAVIIIVGIFVLSQVYGTIPQDDVFSVTNSTNQTVTVDYDQVQRVDPPDTAFDEVKSLQDDEVVVNSTDGRPLQEGTDYEWNTSDKKIAFIGGVTTNEGTPVTLVYDYEARPALARDTIGPLGDSMVLGAVAVIVVVAAAILNMIGGFGSMNSGGRR